MAAQSPSKQTSKPLVVPQLPKICVCNIGGMNLCHYFVADICLLYGREVWAAHTLQPPWRWTCTSETSGACSCMPWGILVLQPGSTCLGFLGYPPVQMGKPWVSHQQRSTFGFLKNSSASREMRGSSMCRVRVLWALPHRIGPWPLSGVAGTQHVGQEAVSVSTNEEGQLYQDISKSGERGKFSHIAGFWGLVSCKRNFDKNIFDKRCYRIYLIA